MTQIGETPMAIETAKHARLLLTADLLQGTRRVGLSTLRLDEVGVRHLDLRFPPIEDLVGALDLIASREAAA
jgi:hypothetical protein